MLGRFNANYKHGEVSAPASLRELELSAKKMQGCNTQILLSFTSDPYSGGEGVTGEVLKILNEYGHKVAILTKNLAGAIADLSIIRSFGDRIKVGATLTCRTESDSLEWELAHSLPADRVEALRELASWGIKTWASFEPVVIPEQSLALLDEVSAFIDHVKVGKLNNFRGLDKKTNWSKFLS